MTSLPVKSWLSFSEGFLSPKEAVKAVKKMGFETGIFADSGDTSGVRDFLTQAAEEGIGSIVGVEFLLAHNGVLRKITAIARGSGGLDDFFKMVSKFYHPKDPSRPKGTLLPGCECELPSLSLEDVPKGIVLVSGGKESYFEDCRSRSDIRSFLKFVDEVRKRGVGIATGYDPGLADQRDASFIGGLKKHAKPVAVLPWRWTACDSSDEEKFNTSVRSVFGKSPDPVAIRVGVSIEAMSNLAVGNDSDREIEGFVRATKINPGEVKFSENNETELRFRGVDGKDVDQQEACEILKKTAVKNLDALIAKTGLRSERAEARKQFYMKRLEDELRDIAECKVAGRILHVSELMSFCRRSGIKAMARGSVANSLVCYLNRIHPVNPVTFGLPSQRFVNPKRKTTPDIDVDIASSRAMEARDFLCKAGAGGVGLRSTITAGFVDILQRELKAAGVPFAHELRDRIKSSFGGRRVPNTYAELEEEFLRYAKLNKDASDGDFVSFVCSKMSNVDRETIQAAIRNAKSLEGRPVYHIDHVGVGMKTTNTNPYAPIIRGADGNLLLAVPHDQSEQWGFSKIDVLSRRMLDLVDKVQSNIEKNGGKLRSVGAVFSASKKGLPELREGLVGGLDQIGGVGKGQIPHRQFLSSWDEEFTNFDLVNYLALVRYGSHGWSKNDKPSGEFRPKMLALYCGNFAAGAVLGELGIAVAKKYGEQLSLKQNVDKWEGLARLVQDSENAEKGDLGSLLKNLPTILAKTDSLGEGDAGEQVLARITWDGQENKKNHLAKCRSAIAKKRAGDDSQVRKILSEFYGIDAGNDSIANVSNSLAAGKVIDRPPYILALGKTGVEVWDKVTSDTRGLLLFQEQVTDLLCQISGCSYASADLVRDAVAHRGRVVPDEVKKEIFDGVRNKTGLEVGGENLLNALIQDGPYLFNKGHAAVYAGLIIWQLEAKKNWPASFANAYIEYARKGGAKGVESSTSLGGVLGDAEKLGCVIDVSELPARATTEAVEKVGQPGVLKLGLDAFFCFGEEFIGRWKGMTSDVKKGIGKLRGAEQLCRSPYHLSPEEAEVVFAMTRGPKEKSKVLHKYLGMVPSALRMELAPDSRGAVPAEDLNFYKNSKAKTSNIWGFVATSPKVYPGGGKRPCRVTCSLGCADGRAPVEISYVFWADRGKESSHFLPKEAVDLQSRLNSFYLRSIPISTVVRLNDFFARWDGSVSTIQTVGGGDKVKGEVGKVDSDSQEVITREKQAEIGGLISKTQTVGRGGTGSKTKAREV